MVGADPFPLVGETCALLAALTWSIAIVLFKRSGETVAPLSLSLFKNIVGIVLLAVTLPIVGEGLSIFRLLDPSEIFILVISGIIGIAIADTIMFYALNLIGVGLLTIAECAYAPGVVVFAWLLLAEEIAAHHFVGGALVVVAVFISSTHKPPVDRTRNQLLLGMFLGAFAVTLMAAAIVIAKPVLERAPLISASMLRLVGGTVVLGALMAASPYRRKLFGVFKPSPVWRTCVPAAALGTYLAMIFWIAGFKYAGASVAAILNQTSTVMALIFATLILKERFTRRKFVSAVLAFGGVMIVMAWETNGREPAALPPPEQAGHRLERRDELPIVRLGEGVDVATEFHVVEVGGKHDDELLPAFIDAARPGHTASFAGVADDEHAELLQQARELDYDPRPILGDDVEAMELVLEAVGYGRLAHGLEDDAAAGLSLELVGVEGHLGDVRRRGGDAHEEDGLLAELVGDVLVDVAAALGHEFGADAEQAGHIGADEPESRVLDVIRSGRHGRLLRRPEIAIRWAQGPSPAAGGPSMADLISPSRPWMSPAQCLVAKCCSGTAGGSCWQSAHMPWPKRTEKTCG